MDIDLKRTSRGWGVALGGLLLAGAASGQDPATTSRFPTIPAEHSHARMLLDNAMGYASPANKIVDPVSGYPFEGWNQDPKRGLYLRSFTQLTAIGQWMELLANVAAGNADTPHLSREQALQQLTHLVKTLRQDQADPKLSAQGLLGNFLDLATGKRLGPLASNVDKSKFLEAFGPTKGEASGRPSTEPAGSSPARTAMRPTSPGGRPTATSTSPAPSPRSRTRRPGRRPWPCSTAGS